MSHQFENEGGRRDQVPLLTVKGLFQRALTAARDERDVDDPRHTDDFWQKVSAKSASSKQEGE